MCLGSMQVPVEEIPEGWMGLDIGEQSAKDLCEALSDCKTVVWNGPMGVFEFDKFANGTFSIAKKLAELTPTGRDSLPPALLFQNALRLLHSEQ